MKQYPPFVVLYIVWRLRHVKTASEAPDADFFLLIQSILLSALAITYGMSARQYRESQEALFLQTFSSVREELGKPGNISAVWLEQQEQADSILIWISDNGVPFHFSGTWQPPTDRNELASLAPVCALAAVSWFLAGLTLRPTAEALRRQTEFVAAASHELRSPLTVIKASLSAALADPKHIQTKFLDAARDESDRMAHLIDDLLMLAGSDAGTWSIHIKEVDLDTFCIELYERFHLICQNQGHSLALDLPDDPLPRTTFDQERMTQLIGILLSNACSYTPPNTPIEICVRSQKSHVELAVQDHDPGIPDEEKKKVFRRFYRADASRTDKQHFGLGLAVAAELAVLHGFVLSVRDTPAGGATFVLQLPF